MKISSTLAVSLTILVAVIGILVAATFVPTLSAWVGLPVAVLVVAVAYWLQRPGRS